VLVVGGLGFIGINLTKALAAAGARLTVLTPDIARHAEAAMVVNGAGGRVVEGDVRDAAVVREHLAGRDVVFNLAARSGAVLSMEDPLTDLDVNCRGNLTLLEALRAVSPSAKLVIPGSRLQYGRAAMPRVGEDHPMEPLCVHGAHKALVESYLSIYGEAYGLRWTAVRITNPYGPGQPFDDRPYGVVNIMIRLAMLGRAIPIYGDGLQVRDYVFIDDVVEALFEVGATASTDGRVYNVGSGVGTPFVEMARRIQEAVGGGRLEFVPWPPIAERIETGDFVADVSRLTADTRWRPLVGIDEGLRRSIAAYGIGG
jgi:nucleoside-diphosphate-sugar epimerase